MQKTGWAIHSSFSVLSGLERVSFWMWSLGGVNNHFPVYWAIFGVVTNEQTNNQVILVQACYWPVRRIHSITRWLVMWKHRMTQLIFSSLSIPKGGLLAVDHTLGSTLNNPARLKVVPYHCTYCTICQIRYQKQIVRRWHCLVYIRDPNFCKPIIEALNAVPGKLILSLRWQIWNLCVKHKIRDNVPNMWS